MKDNEAIQLLEKSLKQTDVLKQSYNLSSEHTKWLSDTLYLVEEIFGKKSRIYFNLALLSWQNRGSFRLPMHPERELEYQNHQSYLNDLEIARGLIESGIDLIKRKGLDAVYEGKDTPKEASEILKIISLIENCLRRAIHTKPIKEKDVQDALETLFLGAEFSFTREDDGIPFSTKIYYPDFVFKRIETVVEVKLCDDEPRGKQIIGEMNNYIVAFKTKYPNLIFVVYDTGGVISDENKFKGSFEQQESVTVIIKKH
jgi:hypothetical protein